MNAELTELVFALDRSGSRSIVAYFITEDGEKISFDVPMIANSREDAPEKRTFHEKFTLKSREYKYGDKYYLVLADANDEKRDELRAKNQMKSKEYDEVEHKIKEIRGEIRKEERKYVERAQVIGTTISRATIDPMFEERQFDLVMFDEVSMAYVPHK